MDNLVLIGMPGSGKSSVGVLLAKTLGYGFLDVDLLIQQREGALLQHLVDRLGSEGFLDAEARVIRTVACRSTVVAPGGSAVCRPDAMDHLKALGTVVYLRLPCEALEKRIRNMGTRGIVMAPGQTFRDLYNERVPLYDRYADLTVDAEGQTLEETVDAVRQALAAHGIHSSRTFLT
ncbi:MAG: shikimate kinase [Clostridiales bacterium]|nr:shikimate kinase [Clostridiales bacterium]